MILVRPRTCVRSMFLMSAWPNASAVRGVVSISSLLCAVMGGKSDSTIKVDSSNKVGVFDGTCAIVPSLNAPGFCKVTTKAGFLKHNKFADISSHLAGHMELRVRSSTPKFAGYRVAFSAKDVPSTSR